MSFLKPPTPGQKPGVKKKQPVSDVVWAEKKRVSDAEYDRNRSRKTWQDSWKKGFLGSNEARTTSSSVQHADLCLNTPTSEYLYAWSW